MHTELNQNFQFQYQYHLKEIVVCRARSNQNYCKKKVAQTKEIYGLAVWLEDSEFSNLLALIMAKSVSRVVLTLLVISLVVGESLAAGLAWNVV